MAYGIHSDVAQDQFGNAVANASVVVYTITAGSVVTTPLPVIYTAVSSIGASPVSQANPMTTDSLGRYSFGAPDGYYAIEISGSTFPTYRVYKNIVSAYLPGAGGVSSVSLGLPPMFTVSGSPVTGVGTLTGTLSNQAANAVLVGPTFGGATTPTFRALIVADLPVSGVTAATYQSYSTVNHRFTLASFVVSAQGVITNAGALGAYLLAQPDASIPYTWTASQNVASVALTFANPLATDATLSNTFHTTATSNFTFQNPTGLVSGGTYMWRIQQDGTGGKLISAYGTMFKFPGGVPQTLSTAAGAVDLFTAYYDGTNLLCNILKAFA